MVFRCSMFPCSSLRDDCWILWILIKFNSEILTLKSADFDLEIHKLKSLLKPMDSDLNPWTSMKSADLLWISWNLHTWGLGLSSGKVFQTKYQQNCLWVLKIGQCGWLYVWLQGMSAKNKQNKASGIIWHHLASFGICGFSYRCRNIMQLWASMLQEFKQWN